VVAIEMIPESLKGGAAALLFSFIHTSDLHLDCPFDGLGHIPTDLGAVLRQATFTAFDQIIDLCIERKAAFLLVAGDVYNSEDRSLRAQLRFRNGLAKLSDTGIASYVVFGNHDPTSGWSASLDWPANVHILHSKGVETHEACCGGTQVALISGISYPKKDVRDNLASQFPKRDGSLFSIALLHCSCGFSGPHEPYAACDISDLSGDYDYWALGHVHTRGVLRQSSPIVVYPGNPQGLNPKETGPRGCYLVEVDDSGEAHLEFVETDAVRWFWEDVSVEGLSREQDILDALGQSMEEVRSRASRPALVRWNLTGRTPLHRLLSRPDFVADLVSDLREAESTKGSDLVWVESIRNMARPVIDIEERRRSEDFTGDFVRLAQAVRGSKEELAKLGEVLMPVLAQSDASKYLPSPTEAQILAWLEEAELHGLDELIGDGGGE